jgi:hypothetical protein
MVFLLLLSLLPSRPSQAQTSKEVWAFYLGFWAMDSWAASAAVLTDEPLSRYDSRDGQTLRTQITQAKGAGIDAFIVSWFGPQDAHTSATVKTALQQAAGRDFQVGVALDLFPGNVPKDQASITAAIREILRNYGSYGAYLRFDGKPVIYFAFQETAGLSSATWRAIRDELDPDRQSIWVAEGLNGCCLHNGAFDGLYAFNLAWGDPLSNASTQFTRLRNAGGYFYTATAHPGWNEDLVAARDGRTNPTSPRDRANGQFLINSWNGAVASGAGIILLVSWNEYMEGSHIEPSVKYGSQSLDILTSLIRDWKAGVASQTTAPAAAPAAKVEVQALPAGTRLTITVESMNVRAAPDRSSAVVASAFAGQNFEVLGQAQGWYLIRINGLEGYVLGDYVLLSQ